MEYLTPKQAAEKWGVSLRTIHAYCSNNKIAGVIRTGKHYLIPKTAKRPGDMRIKAVRAAKELEDYHFPMLVFSRFYVDRDELNEDEHSLLDAQILYLEGKCIESVQLCRKLISQNPSESVRFGAYWTNALNFQYLGLPYETTTSMNDMAAICQQSPHQEDYRMMMAYCSVHQILDPKDYFSIDPTKLCGDALLFYGCFSLMIAALRSSTETPYATAVYSGFCQQLGLLEIHPLHFILHSSLAVFYANNGDEQGKTAHLREACRIGHDFDFEMLLLQYLTVASDVFEQGICLYGKEYAKKIEKDRSQGIKNYVAVTNFFKGKTTVLGESLSENEIIFLLASYRTNKEIAVLKNISEREVRKRIKNICERCGLHTKKELVYYCKELMGNITQT